MSMEPNSGDDFPAWLEELKAIAATRRQQLASASPHTRRALDDEDDLACDAIDAAVNVAATAIGFLLGSIRAADFYDDHESTRDSVVAMERARRGLTSEQSHEAVKIRRLYRTLRSLRVAATGNLQDIVERLVAEPPLALEERSALEAELGKQLTDRLVECGVLSPVEAEAVPLAEAGRRMARMPGISSNAGAPWKEPTDGTPDGFITWLRFEVGQVAATGTKDMRSERKRVANATARFREGYRGLQLARRRPAAGLADLNFSPPNAPQRNKTKPSIPTPVRFAGLRRMLLRCALSSNWSRLDGRLKTRSFAALTTSTSRLRKRRRCCTPPSPRCVRGVGGRPARAAG